MVAKVGTSVSDQSTKSTDVQPRDFIGPVLTFVGAVVFMAVVLYVAGHSGGTLSYPAGGRAWELGITGIAIAILGVGAVQSIRTRKFSRMLLMAVAAGTAFWQETYGDWGTYLLYSPSFATYDWAHTEWSSPNQCWWFIAGYVFFYTTFFLALENAFNLVRVRWPSVNPYLATTVAAFPMFYVFDLTLEGAAHGFGWWQYQYAFGPSIAIGDGRFPLLWPILEQVPFMVGAVSALCWRNSAGADVFEVVTHKVTRRQRPNQVSILLTWIVILNVAFLVSTTLPLMVLRWIAGPGSSVVP